MPRAHMTFVKKQAPIDWFPPHAGVPRLPRFCALAQGEGAAQHLNGLLRPKDAFASVHNLVAYATGKDIYDHFC